MMEQIQQFLAPLAAMATPEALVVLDMAVLAALAVMIVVGVVVGRRLKELHAARAEWAEELAEFSKKADAAEEGLSRLRALLLAEADRRHAAHEQAASQELDAKKKNDASGASGDQDAGAAPSIMSMQ